MTDINNNSFSKNDRTLGIRRAFAITMAVAASGLTTGCTSFLGSHGVTGIPVSRVPQALLNAQRKDDFEDISLLRLRQDPPEFYALGPGDVLGVDISGITSIDPSVAAALNENSDAGLTVALPQVHYREDSDLPPAVGFPMAIREDGTLALPYVQPVSVEGMSLVEATQAIQNAYYGGEQPILKLKDGVAADGKVSVTMIHRRTVRVLVIREESGGAADVTKRGTGAVVDLPAYENDVLHALSETGGMPGLDAKNEVIIMRGLYEQGMNYDNIMSQACVQNCHDCEDPCFCDERELPDPPNMTRIPLRFHPTRPPTFMQEDVLLSDGDIVIIRSRDRETFYTAGLLGGGEFPLPRDKDLDVIGAIALAGGGIGQGSTGISALGRAGGQGGFGGGGGGQGGANSGFCQASEVLIVRDLPCGNQITLKVSLDRALTNRSERVLIQPGDIVLLRYTLKEEIGNLVLGLLPSYLIGNGLNR